MVRNHDLRGRVVEEGISGEEEDDQGVVMGRTMPLEEVFSAKEGGG